MNQCLLDNKEILSNIRIELSPSNSISSINYFIYNKNIFVGSFSISTVVKGSLLELYIEKEYRRQGIGSLVISQFKITTVQCTTWNDEGIPFYKSNGFEVAKADVYLIDFKRNI